MVQPPPDPAWAMQAALRVMLGAAGDDLADLGALRGPRFHGILGAAAAVPAALGLPVPPDLVAALDSLPPPAPVPRHVLLIAAPDCAAPLLAAWPRTLVTLAAAPARVLADLRASLPPDQATRLGLLAVAHENLAPAVPVFDLILSQAPWPDPALLAPLAGGLRPGGRLVWHGDLGASLADLAAALLARVARGDVVAPGMSVLAALHLLAQGNPPPPDDATATALARQGGFSWARRHLAGDGITASMALRAALAGLLEVPAEMLAPCLPDWAWRMAEDAAPPLAGWLVCGRDWA